jgi:hypothetical protein
VLLSLYTHFSRPFWTDQSLAYPVVQKSGAAAVPPLPGVSEDNLGTTSAEAA